MGEVRPKLQKLIDCKKENVESPLEGCCCFCGASFKDIAATSGLFSCKHVMHLECMTRYVAEKLLEQEDLSCPECRQIITLQESK